MEINAKAAKEDGTVTDGTDAIGEAIGYGVACGLGSPPFLAALAAGLGPATAGPAIAGNLTSNVAPDQA